MGFIPERIVGLPESAVVTADAPKYPIGFPSPPYEFRLCFIDRASKWRNVYGTRPASIELRQVLEQFIADISTSATRLEIAKDKVKYAHQYMEAMRENILPGCYTYVDFLQESIEKVNTGIGQNEKRLEEAQISLNRAQSEYAAYMALNPHICTAQDMEGVLNQQCDLEQIPQGDNGNKHAHSEERDSAGWGQWLRLKDRSASTADAEQPIGTVNPQQPPDATGFRAPQPRQPAAQAYPPGFPSPPAGFEALFNIWAAGWRSSHGGQKTSDELRLSLERFVADISANVTVLTRAWRTLVDAERGLADAKGDLSANSNTLALARTAYDKAIRDNNAESIGSIRAAIDAATADKSAAKGQVDMAK
ncbi:hypothetical protein GGI17_005487 [Coemansia sp. S146]|nr:hypothetical protein GGI17_005487 [Coemansia sp. S146]